MKGRIILKKRITSLAIVLCFLFSMLPSAAFAAGGNGISASKETVEAGDTFSVKVEIPNIPESLSNLQITVSFDNSVFEVTEYLRPSFATMSTDVASANIAGKITCTNTSSTGENTLTVLQSGGIMEATFKAKDTAITGDYHFTITVFDIQSIDESTYMPIDRAPAGTVKDVVVKVGPSTPADTPIDGDLPISITAPVKDATPQSTISDTAQYTGTIAWEDSPVAFDPGTVYTAKVELTAKSGYQFASSVNPTVTGATSITEKTVSSDGNKLTFKVTFPATADKDPASVTTAPAAKTGLVYNGTEQALITAGVATGGTMQYSLDGSAWSDSIPKGKDAMTYTVYYMVKGDGSHSDYTPSSNTVSVTITPKSIDNISVTVEPIADEIYDGNAKTPAPVVKDGSVPLTSADYTVSYENNINAGTATVTIQGIGNYGSHRTANFTINKAAQTITVPAEAQTVSFGNTLYLETLCYSNAPGATLTFAVKSGSTFPDGTNLSGGTVTAGTTEGEFIITVNSAAVTNYEAAAEQEFTVKIVRNKKPSGGSGSGDSSGGGYPLPMKPVDDTFSQPAGCVSDTIGEVNVSGAYQFRLTSTNGSTPVVTLSGTAFHGVFASQEGNDYFYKVYADGQPGQTCIVTVNGTTVARLTIVSASGSGVISDTTAPFTVPQGGAYQFRLTADTKPTMTAGSPSFTVAYVGNEGKDWFFKVYAVGQPGDGCGFYINGAPVPVAVAHIS